MSHPVPESLVGAWARFHWARYNIGLVEKRAFEVSRFNRQFVEEKKDEKTGERVFYLTDTPAVPFDFPLQVGVVVHALRSTLDNLAFALCVAGPGGRQAADKAVRQIHFPITKGNASQYLVEPARKAIMQLAKPGAEEAFDAVQPYTGGAGEVLVWLKRLNDVDKHRLLITVCLQRAWNMASDQFDPAGAEALRVMKGAFVRLGLPVPDGGRPLQAGDEVHREPFDAKPNENVNLSFPIAFNEPDILPVEPVVEVLHGAANFISRIAPSFFPFA